MDAISDVSRGSEIFSAVPKFPPLPKPLNIDDLFGFSEAARKRLVEEPVETKFFIPNKTFINQVDSFTGKHIVAVLSEKCDESLILHQVAKDSTSNEDKTKEIIHIEGLRHNSQSGAENTSSEGADATLDITQKDVSEREGDSDNGFIADRIMYDTSQLTVAEYYEMMELESSESRNEFVKEKLGNKFYVDSSEVGVSKNELETYMQERKPLSLDAQREFEIIGTLLNPNLEEVEGVTEILRTSHDDPEFLEQLVTCGIIIYSLNDDLSQAVEATWVLNYLMNFVGEMNKSHKVSNACSPVFILVSTFMTWILTKPISLEEELPFIEKDYRKRKPHPNYEVVYELEELVLKSRVKCDFKSLIIVSGIPYGHEECELRYLFEKAYNYKHLPIYSYGNNLVPMVHVENLGRIVKQAIRKTHHVTIPFIFAQDPIQHTIADISKAISLHLGTGYCEFQSKEAAFINNLVSQDLYNKVTNKIYLESCYPLFSEEEISWKYESGFTENINKIVKEYIDAEKIKPFRIIIYGTPNISTLIDSIAKKVSKHFRIPYIEPDDLICEYVDEVLTKETKFGENKLSETKYPNLSNGFNEAQGLILCGDEKCIEADIELLKRLNVHTCDEAKLLQQSDKIRIIVRRLQSRPYIYQGFILVEYPQSLEEATSLFSEGNNDLSDEESCAFFPDIVIFLNHPVKVSKSQVLDMIDGQLQANEEHTLENSPATKFSEEEPTENTSTNNIEKHESVAINIIEENEVKEDVSNTNEFENEEVPNPILQFFSDSDKHCVVVNLDIAEKDTEDRIFKKTLNIIQKTYFTRDQSTTDLLSDNEQHLDSQSISSDEGNNINIISHHSKSDEFEIVVPLGLKEAEEITLAIRSQPLISYIISFISPTLTNGILEVAAEMPDDPVDFLAEYIFKNNPDGRMMPQNEQKFDVLTRNKKKSVPEIDSKACFA